MALFGWVTLKKTMRRSPTPALAPIATLCHVFIRSPSDPPRRGRTSNPRRGPYSKRLTQIKARGHKYQSNCIYPTYALSGRNVSREAYSLFAVRASKQGPYWNRYLRRSQPHPYEGCSRPRTPFYVQKTRKERIPVLSWRGPFLDCDHAACVQQSSKQ